MRQNQKSVVGVAGAVRACFRYAPGAAAVKLLIEVINGVIAPLTALAAASFIDGALAYVGVRGDARGGAGWVARGDLFALIAAVAVLAAFYAYAQIGQVVARVADKALENALRERLRPLLIQKQIKISYALLEESETADLIALVCGKAEGQMASILNASISAVRLAVQAAGTLALLAAHVWPVIPLFIVGAVPIAIIARKGGKAIYASDAITTVLTRRHYYLSSVLTGRDTAAERTLFGYADSINKKYSAAHLKRSNMVTKEIAMEEAAVSACELIINGIVIFAAFALVKHVGNGTVSNGLYVSLIGALIGLARLITSSVSRLISDMTGFFAYMRDYVRFFSLPEMAADAACNEKNYGAGACDGAGAACNEKNDGAGACDDAGGDAAGRAGPSFERLVIRDLRFRYTPDGEYVLNGVNLVMERGRSYSLIGRNGAGKSTLVKILLGLYRDFEGEILIDGVDIAKYGAESLRRVFSVVYQDFAKYYISLGENITLGRGRGGLDLSLRLAELEDVVDRLPNKERTPLGAIFEGGADISGGEWQKVAIARALYADAPFMILDEPTASLSPMAESKLYGRFAEITKGRASLLISHRLGSTKLSDVLFVLDDGVIVETGAHAELMAADGVYASMFKSQRGWYDEGSR